MEQVAQLGDRIRELKAIAASIHEGAIHTRLFPEIDNILALPDSLAASSVGDREAVARQVREYEQTFDQIGYRLLKQLMPTTDVSPVFQVVQAADAFKRHLRGRVGQSYQTPEGPLTLEHHHVDVLGRYSLSIGTPPVTAAMRGLVSRILLGKEIDELLGFVEVLGADPVELEQLMRHLERLVGSSLHYCTAGEEAAFLRDAAEFVNFEGGRIFNRVVITENPDRVIALLQNHVFDKFGPGEKVPVHVVPGVDRLDNELCASMQAEPNKVFVVRVTRIPHLLFGGEEWRSVFGRLVLIDDSEHARNSNTTVIYTLFPHVARTLRNIQTCFAGRPANTQLELRRILERFSPETLVSIRRAIDSTLEFLEGQGVLAATVEEVRAQEWTRHGLFDYLALIKLRRLVGFLELLAGEDDAARREQLAELRRKVAADWMRYFYRGLPRESYRATVVPGGGRGALTLLGEFHRQQVREAVDRFRQSALPACRERLAALKQGLQIPSSSTDEVQAAIKQSQIRALSPTQWQADGRSASLPDYLARTLAYRLADSASQLARRTRDGLDHAAFTNLTGGAAAFLKRAFSQAGLGALHGRLEDLIGETVGRYDRRVRDMLAPVQEVIRTAQRSIDGLKGDLDPIAVGEIEAVLQLVEQGHFYPTLILPAMSWSYHDVFPEKYFPKSSTILVPLNDQHELDPGALLERLEQLRYLFRRFPELFELLCRSMLLVINSPHNPTGTVYRRETALLLLKIASEYGFTVLDDNASLKGDLDPIAVGEIEAMLQLVEQGHFYPTLILPAMSWSYHDVFPEKYFPKSSTILVPLNDQHELDPGALLERLEQLRYLFRRFPELFELLCRSMLLVINSPHNPTGTVYRRETALLLLKIASEYGFTVLDDNAYHKVVFSAQKAREGEDCLAQTYEKYRSYFGRPVRLLTASGTTKGLQGAGDRTGLILSNLPEAIDFAETRASEPHQLSLLLTRAKLETGLAAKRCTRELEQIAASLLSPAAPAAPWERLRQLLDGMHRRAREDAFEGTVFATLLEGYEELLRIRHRGGSRLQLSECLSGIVTRLKGLRLERQLRRDVEQRVARVLDALERALPKQGHIEPRGAFYLCVRLCDADDDRGVQAFLCALSRHRKVDVTYAGGGYVRLSLGGELTGDAESYARMGQAVEVYLRVLGKYWRAFVEAGRDVTRLEQLLAPEGDGVQAVLDDLGPLLSLHPASDLRPGGLPLAPSERGVAYCIEEGRSVTDKIFVSAETCEAVDDLLRSRPFRVIYRRLLKRVYRDSPALAELSFDQLENQYGPLACLTAYQERQLIDEQFREIMVQLYRAWHSQSTIRVLAPRLDPHGHAERVAALFGLSEQIHETLHELMHAFDLSEEVLRATTSFDIGLELHSGVEPAPGLPTYLQAIIGACAFAGATAALNPTPSYLTGAQKRVSDYRYGFLRRDRASGQTSPDPSYFRQRLAHFALRFEPRDYLCKALQVGPCRMLLVIHKSCVHLVSDELRLFPQIEEVQAKHNLDGLEWDGVLLYGLPAKVMGDAYKSGYIIDRTKEGAPLPTAWVAREDATDYFGFLKKSLLTLHNERVKAAGGMPVHGSMITITFVNGLRKTLVFAGDSGTGKSETITAMMEAIVSGKALATELQQVDILAGDMLSLWRGEDGQLYAFGTETGDFLRLTDITESWKSHFGDLLKRGSFSNMDHPLNPRVTIPGICDTRKVLSPTRVNGLFYINNYEPVRGSAVELSDDPHHVLKTVLVRGLRKNKGTAGDQPSLRASLEAAGRDDLVTRYRHAIDELLEWQQRVVDGRTRTCLAYRDGAGDVYLAREVIGAAFVGTSLGQGARRVLDVQFDLMQNIYWLICDDRSRVVLDREAYDQVYAPLVSTFCGNPFVDPEGMEQTLGRFATTMREARVHAGVIRTQLAVPGYAFSGPDKASCDIVAFLLEDEEVNARFQRNKTKVQQAMQRCYGGILTAGTNLPVELEGYNLLLLEKFESTHVRFRDAEEQLITLDTPHYSFRAPDGAARASFVPAIALPEMLAAIADICGNPDHDRDLGTLKLNLGAYRAVRHWNDLDELTYQVLLVHNVIKLGSSETELARFPGEVRKARFVAERIAKLRAPAVEDSSIRVVKAIS